jgi:spore coat polysaccharide biosynthesis predicted glycosyltransferase SpsG
MANVKICFITDGGKHLGLGHVQQSTAFAQELASEADICFLTKSDDAVLSKIRENGFEVIRHESDASILRHLETLSPDIVIFDKLDVAEDLARDIKRSLNAHLVIFTNLTRANRYADIAVTADIGSRFENISFFDEETKTLYFYGPKYWILKPAFYDYWRRGKQLAAVPKRILLIFGGSDPANLTSAALDQLLSLDKPYRLDVVLGAHYHHDDDLRGVLQRHGARGAEVTVYQNITNVAELMYEADLVIASPGLSAFESLRVGTPVIVVPHDALQSQTYQGFMRMLQRDELWKMGDMIEKRDFSFPRDTRIARMEIGEGVRELKELIVKLPVRPMR